MPLRSLRITESIITLLEAKPKLVHASEIDDFIMELAKSIRLTDKQRDWLKTNTKAYLRDSKGIDITKEDLEKDSKFRSEVVEVAKYLERKGLAAKQDLRASYKAVLTDALSSDKPAPSQVLNHLWKLMLKSELPEVIEHIEKSKWKNELKDYIEDHKDQLDDKEFIKDLEILVRWVRGNEAVVSNSNDYGAFTHTTIGTVLKEPIANSIEEAKAWYKKGMEKRELVMKSSNFGKVVMKTKSGMTWVQLTASNVKEFEGHLMHNCMRWGYYHDTEDEKVDNTIYGLWDKNLHPHVTVRFFKDSIMEVKGEKNEVPKKYKEDIIELLNSMGGKVTTVEDLVSLGLEKDKNTNKIKELSPKLRNSWDLYNLIVDEGDLEEVERILKDKSIEIDPNMQDDHGHSLFSTLFEREQDLPSVSGFPLSQLLVERGANVDIADKSDWTPLIDLISKYKISFKKKEQGIEFLLANGADINKSSDVFTPLITAIRRGSLDLAYLLMHKGADVNKPDEEGKTPLMWVAYVADTERGPSPLLMSSQHRYEKFAETLLDSGAKINSKDHKGKTAIDYVSERHVPVLYYLIEERLRKAVGTKVTGRR